MLENLMVDIVGPLVGGRVFPDSAAGDTKLPFVIYQKVGGVDPVFLDGTLPDKENARVQVVVWARKRTEASTLMRQIKETLCGAPTLAQPAGPAVSRSDDVTKFLGSQQDFSIWYSPS
ncbi:hypothetical protein CAL29_28085 [Bordetella genomosp. 10]|uniref:DUF3168 domain-containing protein n=1 Tax=Bordetella genomosp. 10 TaxID=1416804 RepID=A0A261S3J2_9BORD|nr:DUF3168 domain-containing protein [Bordetella genomosp. 10]OZI31735.1 hypothetical protein CAL29_28085 [Bordetella genomosp. 10]